MNSTPTWRSVRRSRRRPALFDQPADLASDILELTVAPFDGGTRRFVVHEDALRHLAPDIAAMPDAAERVDAALQLVPAVAGLGHVAAEDELDAAPLRLIHRMPLHGRVA